MTTPEERRRNLIWGREALEEIAQDASLTTSWKAEATELLASYPGAVFLQQFDAGDPAQLNPHADVLKRAKSLFQQVVASPGCSEQRRYSLKVVLRHFH